MGERHRDLMDLQQLGKGGVRRIFSEEKLHLHLVGTRALS